MERGWRSAGFLVPWRLGGADMTGPMARIGFFGAAAILVFAFSCSRDDPADAEKISPAVVRPAVGWDTVPNSEQWTTAALAALDTHGASLPAMVPADIDSYCPGYAEASEAERKAFWVAFSSV